MAQLPLPFWRDRSGSTRRRLSGFVEVKYRSGRAMGEGSCAVDARKQRRICSTAAWYLMEYHLPATTPCRFDVVSVDGEEISLIQDAFAYRN